MAAKTRPGDKLAAYRAKRSAGRTTEPFDSVRTSSGRHGIFVMQKHAARRMHYDFRLELDGVLLSWAIPHGPSTEANEKRLAVMVDSHPIDYADFEGIIPEGNYGAGAVIVWDRGTWEPVEDPTDWEASGKLHFDLKGFKMRGRWTLVRTKRPRQSQPGNEWLLFKKKDGFEHTEGQPPLREESVLSGLTVEQLRDGPEIAEQICEELRVLGAPKKKIDASKMKLMLCQPMEAPFSRSDWLFELKYDGYRLVASTGDGQPLLRYRRGRDASALYPDLVQAFNSLPYKSLVVDGEVVVFDDVGRSDFGLLQRRASLERAADIKVARIQLPATFIAFDLLGFEGYDLRGLPLRARKQLLSRVLPGAGVLRYCDHIEERGEEFYALVEQRGLEGIVAKRADSRYRGVRSEDWLKIRLSRVDDFVIVGYTQPEKITRTGFRALHLAVRDGEKWLYAGRVGSGLDDRELTAIRAKIDKLAPYDYGFEGVTSSKRVNVWIEPKLVCNVEYKEWREGKHVRQPVFLHLRDDKAPEECVRPRLAVADIADDPPDPPKQLTAEATGNRQVALTNLDKIFWPEDGYTKGDLIEYYRAVAPWLMPYMRDRPVVLARYPDGIDGKSFYQKDTKSWVPDWIRRVTVWSEHSQREIHYFLCETPEALVYLANMGSIPLHIWSSRASDLAKPDWCILDLDPKGAPFHDVVTLARAIHKLCNTIGLETFVKTTGSTGLHVLIPLGRQCTFEHSRALGQLISSAILIEHSDIATTARAVAGREGKVYLDFLQNRHGQLLAAPFSVRPLPGAPVSMPLKWSEVTKKLAPRQYTIKNVLPRLKRMKEEPMLPVLDIVPDLTSALARLSELLGPAA